MNRSLGREIFSALWQQLLWAIPFALFFGTMYGHGWRGYWGAYLVSLEFAYTIRAAMIVLEYAIIPRIRRHTPGGRRLPIGVEIALYASTILLASYTAAFLVSKTLIPDILGSLRSFVINGMFSLLFTFLIGGIIYAFHFYRESLERAKAVEAMRAELAEAELRALRAQIHPHFLFNTLNSIASLIPTNPQAAEDLTLRLADIFRYTLRASGRESTPLGEELAFLRDVLDIERARLGERLRIVEEIEPGLEQAAVPSLLLQPLVENAVRYGVAPRPDGGTVRLAAHRDGGTLVLEVADDGPGMPAGGTAPSGTGFGLHSVRERLRASGHADSLAIDSQPGRGTRITVRLPLSNVTEGGRP